MKKTVSGGPFESKMWKPYEVVWTFVGKLCGSHPCDPNVFESWLKARQPSVRPPGGKSISQVMEEVVNRAPNMTAENEEMELRSTVSFPVDKGFICAPAFTVRAHMKDATRNISRRFVGSIAGEARFATKVLPSMYVEGEAADEFGTSIIYPTRDGKRIALPDGFLDRKVHAIGPRGEQVNALKKFGYILAPTMKFTLRVIEKSVSLDDLNTIMMYGATQGYGGERSMGEGRYTYTIKEG